jgi:uncharacterized membrane protein YhaH (DUF805 family)
MLLFILVYMVVAVIDQFLVTATVDIRELPLGHYVPMGMVDPNVGVLVLLYRPVMAIPTIAVTVRRLHDVGKSGRWCLLWVLPLPVVGLLYLVPLLCRPSSD